MRSNPFNRWVGFFLEIAALVAVGYWGWQTFSGTIRLLLALGVPIAAAIIWITFTVPGDPHHPRKPVVRVRGKVRLAIEVAYFGFAAWALYDTGARELTILFAALVLLHLIITYDRIAWLLKA